MKSATMTKRRRSAAEATLARLHLLRAKTRQLYLDAASLVQRAKADKIDLRGVIHTKLRALRSYISSSRDYRLCKERVDRAKQTRQKEEEEEERLRGQIIGDRRAASV